MTVRRHVAEGDCERIRPGLIAQPANTVSSLAFMVAAVPIWRGATGRHKAWRWVAAALAFESAGSVAYHGPGGRTSKFMHDVGLLAIALACARVAGDDPAALRPRPGAVILGICAVALHTLSRTGGPLCSCNSRLQGHAIFHVVAAAAIASQATRFLPGESTV
jgi:hypothetical protein